VEDGVLKEPCRIIQDACQNPGLVRTVMVRYTSPRMRPTCSSPPCRWSSI